MNKIRFTSICQWEFMANQGIISVDKWWKWQRDAKGRNMLQGRVQVIFCSHFIPDLTWAHNKIFFLGGGRAIGHFTETEFRQRVATPPPSPLGRCHHINTQLSTYNFINNLIFLYFYRDFKLSCRNSTFYMCTLNYFDILRNTSFRERLPKDGDKRCPKTCGRLRCL